MPATENSGTQVATVTTEHILHTVVAARTLVYTVDASTMAMGDELELTVKTRVLTGGVDRIAYEASYSNIQAEPIKISIPLISMHQAVFSLKQTKGVSKSFDWSVTSL